MSLSAVSALSGPREDSAYHLFTFPLGFFLHICGRCFPVDRPSHVSLYYIPRDDNWNSGAHGYR
jgi:hypothetical protein